MKVYKRLASALDARNNCIKSGKSEQKENWEAIIEGIMKNAPGGGGFDSGVEISLDEDGKRIVFSTSFHHMNENGFCDGWTEHLVKVKPSLIFDFDLIITGSNRNQIKDYIHEIFYCWLDSEE